MDNMTYLCGAPVAAKLEDLEKAASILDRADEIYSALKRVAPKDSGIGSRQVLAIVLAMVEHE